MRTTMVLGLCLLLAACGNGGAETPGTGGTWDVLVAFDSARTENSAATCDGLLYVMGGFKGAFVAEPIVERYDPATGTWSDVTMLPAGVNHAGLIAFAGKLYLIGGFAEGTFTEVDSVHIYRPGDEHCGTRGMPMPDCSWRTGRRAGGREDPRHRR